MERIGLFGGSFNPVHSEHVKMAIECIKELNLTKLFVIPTKIAPHKQGEVVLSGTDRFNMLKIAFNGITNVEVCDFELNNDGVSYSYLTVRHFKNLYKSANLYFLMGSDMLENFPTWKNPQDIVSNCNLVLVNRENSGFIDSELIEKVNNLFNTKVIQLVVSGKDLSSTEIRIRKMLGLSLNGLVCAGVEEYIENNNLYGENKYYNYVKNNLPEKRKIHVLGVILTAIKLAKKLGVDKSKVELSALLHDVAKYIPVEKQDYKKYGIPLNCPSEVVHQYMGAYVAKNELGILDTEVLDAIRYHTSGRENMSMLEKIIYTADIIEPSRKFVGVEELRKAVDSNFELGFITCVEEILEFLKRQGGEIYPLSIEACEFYKRKS